VVVVSIVVPVSVAPIVAITIATMHYAADLAAG